MNPVGPGAIGMMAPVAGVKRQKAPAGQPTKRNSSVWAGRDAPKRRVASARKEPLLSLLGIMSDLLRAEGLTELE
jgi:hypothetical protein